MFKRFTVTKPKEKKKNFFITQHIQTPPYPYFKKILHTYTPKPPKHPKNEKIKNTKKEPVKQKEKIESKKVEKKDNIIPPKLPCNLFHILHNQPPAIVHPPKIVNTQLKKKRIIDEETGNTIGRWSREEHKKFIEAIIRFGNNWKQVQEYIDTRTSTQARSHAQKFFEKIKKNKTLKNFKLVNTEYSENFTNSTILQLHNLYGNKSKSEINSVVNKFLNLEYDAPKKKRRILHSYIGNKKNLGVSNNKKHYGNKNMDINEENENNENNENYDEKNIGNKNENDDYKIKGNNNDDASLNIYSLNEPNYSRQKIADENAKHDNYNIMNYNDYEVSYILKQLIRNVSDNFCEYDPSDPNFRHKRKNTFGSIGEEPYVNEENINYNQYNNLIYNYNYGNNNNNYNYNNNVNQNLVTKSRKNSIESRNNDFWKRSYGYDEGKNSFDMNELINQNLNESDRIIY